MKNRNLLIAFPLFVGFLFLSISVNTDKNKSMSNLVVGIEQTLGSESTCINCDGDSGECHRVIVGNTVHIFPGEKSICPEPEEN